MNFDKLVPVLLRFDDTYTYILMKSKHGLSKRGFGPKAPIGPKKALSGELLLLPRGCEVGGIGPDQPDKGPDMP